MNYMEWRDNLFGNPPLSDPVMHELPEATYKLSKTKTLQHISTALQDPDIHELYNWRQIGNGLNVIFNNACSDLPFSYIEDSETPTNEQEKIKGIQDLELLYANFFERYCRKPVISIGEIELDSRIDYLCYMFWDIFVLYPGNSTDAMNEAAITTMRKALYLDNDNCVVSALHGLGHWMNDTDLARPVVNDWLANPTTANKVIIDYAEQARTGCVQ